MTNLAPIDVFLGLLVLSLLSALLVLTMVLVKVLLNQHRLDQIEHQRLRNQLLAMGDMSALERLNRTNLPQQESRENSSSYNDEPAVDPQKVINTPNGPVVDLGDGNFVPLTQIDPDLAGMGWSLNPDMDSDVDELLDAEGNYHAGPGSR